MKIQLCLGFLYLFLLSNVISLYYPPTTMSGLNPRSAQIQESSCTWTNSVSSGTIDCPTNQVAVSLQCESSSCASLKLKCCKVKGTHDGSIGSGFVGCKKGFTSYITEAVIETDFASHLSTERKLTDKGNHRFTSGITCENNCNSMKLRGRRLQCGDSHYLIEDEWRDGFCEWTSWHEYGNQAINCPKDMSITGIDCKGLKCSSVRIHCCPFGHVCGKGNYGDNINCHPCPQGYYGASTGLTSSECTAPCPAGVYGEVTGLTTSSCTNSCPEGTYNDKTGQTSPTSCRACPVGIYGNTKGLTNSSCTAPCPIGTYRATTGAKSIQDCLLCPFNTYSGRTGATQCNFCPRGKYSNKLGATSIEDCKICPPNYRGYSCVDV